MSMGLPVRKSYKYTVLRYLPRHHGIHLVSVFLPPAYKMVEADDYLGGVPVQHRQVQGHEDDKFHKYFEAVEYLDGGIESGFNHVEPDPEHPVLFQVKGTKQKMTLKQVPLSKSSLNAGDSFILFGGKAKVWCWHGNKAKPLEKANSNQWAEHMVRTLGKGARLPYW